MVIISDEYKYKELIKTTFKSFEKPTYVLRNLPHAQLKNRASYIASLFIKNVNLQHALENLTY